MEDYCKIKVGGHPTGIMGLKGVLAAMAEQLRHEPDDRIGPLLREKLAAMNYIPSGSQRLYEQAFLLEYQRYIGQPVAAEAAEGLTIRVLGQGCPQCKRLSREVMQLLAENNIPADFEHVTDLQEIAGYGPLSVPALLINGKVRSMGTVPSRTRLLEWLREESR